MAIEVPEARYYCPTSPRGEWPESILVTVVSAIIASRVSATGDAGRAARARQLAGGRANVVPSGPADQSGRVSSGMAKSEAKTRLVLPPEEGLMVPEIRRMARGSSLRLLRV